MARTHKLASPHWKSAGRKTKRDKPVTRQPRLPEMEDPAIQELEDSATEYASIRDRRQQLTTQEVELKGDLLRLMKKHGKQTYHHDGITIKVVHEEETVKVKVKKEEAK